MKAIVELLTLNIFPGKNISEHDQGSMESSCFDIELGWGSMVFLLFANQGMDAVQEMIVFCIWRFYRHYS